MGARLQAWRSGESKARGSVSALAPGTGGAINLAGPRPEGASGDAVLLPCPPHPVLTGFEAEQRLPTRERPRETPQLIRLDGHARQNYKCCLHHPLASLVKLQESCRTRASLQPQGHGLENGQVGAQRSDSLNSCVTHGRAFARAR